MASAAIALAFTVAAAPSSTDPRHGAVDAGEQGRVAPPPENGAWTETYIPTPDGESLHVDVIRPEGATDADKTPVILIVSPYLGMTSPTASPGPSDRFYDFIEGAEVLQNGYSVVMVSLRGTGGSSGCLDILGPGEQIDVVTAVEWAASQPWSTGRVGMYGKSYDANTGALAAALRPEGLEAIVAQQIAPDRYRGSYSDRVRLLQSLAYPSVTYGTQAEGAFSLNNDPTYIANSVSRSADCQVLLAEHYLDDEAAEFWRVRDFVDRAEGSTIPTFITTGYLDNATNIGAGAVDLFNTLAGPKRLWIGWWDHVRGNDSASGDLAMGREHFFAEVMRFYDRYLKELPPGQAPTHRDPVVAAQTSDGTWYEADSFPAAGAVEIEAPILPGTYADDGQNHGSADISAGPGGVGGIPDGSPGNGTWTFSAPLPHTAQIAGIPSATVDVAPVAPRTNVAVNVYDVDPDGSATMITRGAALADAAGLKQVALWPTDWVFEPGHRIGILVSGSNAEAYIHTPTYTTVAVTGGSVTLPVLTRAPKPLPGEPAPRLRSYRNDAPFAVPAETIDDRTADGFPVPPTRRGHR